MAELDTAAAEACGRWAHGEGAGLATAVVHDATVVWSGGFGAAALPDGPAMDVDTARTTGFSFVRRRSAGPEPDGVR